jgi:hypothetical protein
MGAAGSAVGVVARAVMTVETMRDDDDGAHLTNDAAALFCHVTESIPVETKPGGRWRW